MAERLALCAQREVCHYGVSTVAGLLRHQPRRLWHAIERIAQSRRSTVLGQLGASVIEHLLHDDCERYLPLIAEKIRAGDRRWVRILSSCYITGEAVPYEARIHALLNELSTPAERTRWVWGSDRGKSRGWRKGCWIAHPGRPGDDRFPETPDPVHAPTRSWRGGQYGEACRTPEGRRRLRRERPTHDARRRRSSVSNRILTSKPDDHGPMRFSREEQQSLRALASAPDLKTRRRCIDWLEVGVGVPANIGFISAMILELSRDPRDDVRYRSLLIMDMWSLYHPMPVWRLLQALARERSPQLRDAAGVCGLEYFLAAHCDRYFARIEREVRSGVRGWVRMLAAAYILGKAIAFEGRIHALLDEHSTAEERTRWVWRKDAPPADHPRWRDGHFVALRASGR